MTTNGYLLTPDVADKLFAWRIRNFQITLDGLAEHHNHSRVARDGSPTFERIFDNLKALALREESFHVGFAGQLRSVECWRPAAVRRPAVPGVQG